MLLPTLLTLGALAVLLWAEAREHALTKRVAKPLASLGFLLAGLAVGVLDDPYGRAIGLGLVLSAVGDVCLLSRHDRWFLAGLGSFLLAHVAYGAAFVVAEPSWGAVAVAAGPLVGVAILVRRWLRPTVPADMRAPVDAYMLVISVMVALAIGATAAGGTGRMALGAFMFYLSDLSVARDRFVEHALPNRLWGLPMYYGAQLVLASSVGA